MSRCHPIEMKQRVMVNELCLMEKSMLYVEGKKDEFEKKNYCFMLNMSRNLSLIKHVMNMLKFNNLFMDNYQTFLRKHK